MDNKFLKSEIESFRKKCEDEQSSYIFKQPIEEVIASCPGYTTVVSHPIDLYIIKTRCDNDVYSSFEDIKSDFDLMIDNCLTYTIDPNNIVDKTAVKFRAKVNSLFDRFKKKYENFKKKLQNIRTNADREQNKEEGSTLRNYLSNITVVTNNEEEDRLATQFKELFGRAVEKQALADEKISEIINFLVKNVQKRNFNTDEIYNDVMKVLSNHKVSEECKTIISKGLRSILKELKANNLDGGVVENKTVNVQLKISCGDDGFDPEKMDKLDKIKKKLLTFIEEQRVPESYRNVVDFPIE